MPRLTFRLDFKTGELRSLDLPIEVRKPNAVLVRTALRSETLDLPAGEYYATAKLPGGQRLVAPFKLVDPPTMDPFPVVLAPDAEDASAHEWEEVSHFLGRPAARDRTYSDSTRQTAPPVHEHTFRDLGDRASSPARVPHLCIYAGNVLRRTHVALNTASVIHGIESEQDRVVQCTVPYDSRLLIAQLVQPGGAVQNMCLPVSPMAGVDLIISRRSATEYRMEARLKHRAADMLLQYSAYGAAGTAAIASRSKSVDGERMLQDKMADPIAAAVGAYSLLRLGELSRLHDWTEHLRDWFEWLPDGAAICGEHLARVGKHAAAIDSFAKIAERGLPLFSDGVFYAVERLKLYASRTWKGDPPVDGSRARQAFEQLDRFAGFLRRQRPVSSYPGLDVASPDTTPAPETVASALSLDLQTWFARAAADDPAGSGAPDIVGV